MEITAEQIDQKLNELEQRFDQKLAEVQRSIVTWVVSLFLGTAILLTALGSLYINILLGSQ